MSRLKMSASILRTWKIICISLYLVQVTEGSMILSLKMNTTQSSTFRSINQLYNVSSGNAVDGDLAQMLGNGSCTHQNVGEKEVWWRVDLGREVAIEKIDIYSRNEGSYVWSGWKYAFAGYEVYLSNTTNRERLCYADNTSLPSNINSNVSHDCFDSARYVIIYNNRQTKKYPWYSKNAVLVLCEVQVFGCDVGRYGYHCQQICSSKCPGHLCHPDTGYCRYCGDTTFTYKSKCLPCPEFCNGSCRPYGKCRGCIRGKYGYDCDRDCPTTCWKHICIRGNGNCKGCISGKYGEKCDRNCSTTCKANVCHQKNGYCKACVPGLYGDTCSERCGHCENKSCDQSTGSCRNGCMEGWKGDRCNLLDCGNKTYLSGSECLPCPASCKGFCSPNGTCYECINGTYGDRCEMDCPNTCMNKVCDEEHGCKECIAGYYGFWCNNTCPSTCKENLCDQTDGNCIECIPGYNGFSCNITCPSTCLGNLCNQTDGNCIVCINGYHGLQCNLTCPSTCKENLCDQTDGRCIECIEGTYGNVCGNNCSVLCEEDTCGQISGNCTERARVYAWKIGSIIYSGIGASVGVIIIVCITSIIILVRRKYVSTSAITATEPSEAASTTPRYVIVKRVGSAIAYENFESLNHTEIPQLRQSVYEDLDLKSMGSPHLYTRSCISPQKPKEEHHDENVNSWELEAQHVYNEIANVTNSSKNYRRCQDVKSEHIYEIMNECTIQSHGTPSQPDLKTKEVHTHAETLHEKSTSTTQDLEHTYEIMNPSPKKLLECPSPTDIEFSGTYQTNTLSSEKHEEETQYEIMTACTKRSLTPRAEAEAITETIHESPQQECSLLNPSETESEETSTPS